VITSIFHSWEHRLASATKNRVVRPFEWGLEWLPSEVGAAGAAGGAGAVVERYVEDVMRDTQAFFTPQPTNDFAFTPADPERSAGELASARVRLYHMCL